MVRVLEAAAAGRYKTYAALSYLILAKEHRQTSEVYEAARDLSTIGIDVESTKDFLSRAEHIPLAQECPNSRLKASGEYLRALIEFYTSSGFEPLDIQPDHPAAMLAFVARLIKMEIEEPKERINYWRLQHRFIKTYLIDALTCLRAKIPCRFTEATLEAIGVDLDLLLETLTCK
jgi:hypothetical protein